MDGRLIIRNQRIETSEKIVSINPATLETIGEACLASEKEANQAIEAAKKAFPLWSSFSFKERGKIFEKAKQVLLKRSEEIAHLISSEQGRPIAEALVTEVFPCLDNLNYYAKYTEKLLKNEIVKYHQALFRNKKGYFRFEPMGISLVISPWNYPFLIPFVEVLAALAAGNTVILRPSSTTPFIGLSIGEIFQEAG
ncbi:MAG: aldehyde dehydrogenase family protein, partial [Candidatus Aminicenantia bacterium]